jgi:hypothetical protein
LGSLRRQQGVVFKYATRARGQIISYDEKPGIQAIETTASDLLPEPGVHATFAREHEYKHHGTVSLLAAIDFVTSKVYALVKDRQRSRPRIFAVCIPGKALRETGVGSVGSPDGLGDLGAEHQAVQVQ